ncbi:type IV pilus modification protein PilV [Hydrogenophaga sp. PBL-H3]|uniref:type IV pilus modification protein PilV n=1 Tax=Hydrogenophaga sp. PBL-H3 TaxID=434010 RepID=UPI001320106D|nr:type IV pilus modification protein PilV [Hydrogenophaga sp. PBL-H3]QHE76994.1 type IV pilus modification protein PilV [Hydrogenophaga sp. PBL-H3]QHE81418.1 type IV pilus modification protein PilV [Hydrogenophaga sp. PBL-H3]
MSLIKLQKSRRRRVRGSSLIEVMTTLVILMIGLLGLVGVMLQSQRAQVESYERVQALGILQDMADRMNTNRASASCYALTDQATGISPFLGTGGAAVPGCGTGTATQIARAQADMAEWRDLLLGANEALGGANVGAALGARGCITSVPGVPNTYQISVAWQGRDQIAAPPAAVPCASGEFGADSQRRAVSVTVKMADFAFAGP